MFKLGVRVQKKGGYHLSGKVVAIYKNPKGEIRYVVQCPRDEELAELRIYSDDELVPEMSS